MADKEQVKEHLAASTDIDLGQSTKPTDPRKQRIKEHVRKSLG